MNDPHANPPRRVAAPLASAWRAHVPAAWSDAWCPRAFDLGDGATEVVEIGDGPPLVLAPPVPGWKEAYVALAPRLARTFRVITFDARTDFGGAPSWAALERDLARIADALAPGRFVLFGHSLGGALAQRWAHAHPERVRGLVLSSTFARVAAGGPGRARRYLEQPAVLLALRALPERAAFALARRLARSSRWVFDPACDDAALAIVVRGIREASPSRVAPQLRLALAHDARAWLPALDLPALVVDGERDTPLACRGSDEIASLLPRATRATSPGAGHLHPLSGAEWLAERIEAWGRALPA